MSTHEEKPHEEKKPDALTEFLTNNEPKPMQEQPSNVQYFGDNIKRQVDVIEASSTWINIPLDHLAHKFFYDDGIMVSIRPTKTIEIQSFAVVNEKNPYDVMMKLNELLSACVLIKDIKNNRTLPYTELIDGDRDTIAILIAKASSKFGKKIEKEVECECKLKVKIELIPANYSYKNHHPKLEKYFNHETKRYEFKLKNGAKVKLAPPTLGLIQDVNSYMLVKTTKSGGKIPPNVTFMQTLPYIKAGEGVKTMTYEQLEQAEFEFAKMNDELFQVVYDAIDMISFGIEVAKANCQCGREVHTSFGFPNGARSLFIIPNAFDELVG